MRLNRLDLIRYGKFTGHSIDFGAFKPGQPDFHIVYGLNEAGKSTSFSAYLDLLFGIPKSSGYNFMHDYKLMRIGASLTFADKTHILNRIKSASQSLRDENDQPVSDLLLAQALGGIDRASYKSMFSLDDTSLEEGGQAIIQSRGELGELLFSASSGLAGISQSLSSMREEADGLIKKRGSSTRLAELKRRLDELKAEAKALDVAAPQYKKLQEEKQSATEKYDRVTADFAKTSQRKTEVERLLNALPAAQALKRLELELQNLGDLPRPPALWFQRLPRLREEEASHQKLLEQNGRELAALQQALAEHVVDKPALAVASELRALEEGLSHYRLRQSERIEVEAKAELSSKALKNKLSDLGKSGHVDVSALILSDARLNMIRQALDAQIQARKDADAARREEREAQAALDMLSDSSDMADHADWDGEKQRLSQALSDALDGWTRSGLGKNLGDAKRQSIRVGEAAEQAKEQLLPWAGPIEEALRSYNPSRDLLDAVQPQAADLDRQLRDMRQRQREKAVAIANDAARLQQMSHAGFLNDEAALGLRAERNAAWLTHMQSLSKASAEAFHTLMVQDDVLSDKRLAHAQELAELRQIEARLAGEKAGLARLDQDIAEVADQCQALILRILQHMPPVWREENLSASETLALLKRWKQALDDASESEKQRLAAAQTVETLEAEVESHAQRLADLLHQVQGSAPPVHDIAALAYDAQQWLGRWRDADVQRVARQTALDGRLEDLKTRKTKRILAEDALKMAWQSLLESLRGTWLADEVSDDDQMDPGEVTAYLRDRLDHLSRLPALHMALVDHETQLATLMREDLRFTELLNRLESSLAMIALPEESERASAIIARLTGALEAKRVADEKQAAAEKLKLQQEILQQQQDAYQAERKNMCAFFGDDALSAIEIQLEKAQKRDALEQRIAEESERLALMLRVDSYETAEAKLGIIDENALSAELQALESQVQLLNHEQQTCYAAVQTAESKLEKVGGDDVVARLEAEKRLCLMQIEEVALSYLRLNTGIMAAEDALKLYREHHRSSMLTRASEAFQQMTKGRYHGLTTQPERDKEVLVGLGADGHSRLAHEMSTGTQYQLYLALRLAGYEEFAKMRAPVPFIADDIMESFDDERSQQVFHLLGDMAKVGQVIYLTHHQHLCDLARKAVPEVKIHSLP